MTTWYNKIAHVPLLTDLSHISHRPWKLDVYGFALPYIERSTQHGHQLILLLIRNEDLQHIVKQRKPKQSRESEGTSYHQGCRMENVQEVGRMIDTKLDKEAKHYRARINSHERFVYNTGKRKTCHRGSIHIKKSCPQQHPVEGTECTHSKKLKQR